MPIRKTTTSFLDLPFEIRSMIYTHFFSQTYTLPPTRRSDFFALLDDTELLSSLDSPTHPHLCKHLHRTDAALLHESPLIRHEASEILYKTGTFRFCINSYRSNSSSPPQPHSAEKLRHIEIVIDMLEYAAARNQSKDSQPSIDNLCVHTLDPLRLPTPTRESCRVIFRNLCICTDFRHHAPYLFWNLRMLKGFEKVVVEITPCVHLCWKAGDEFLERPLRVVGMGFLWWLFLWRDCGVEFSKQLGVQAEGGDRRVDRSVLRWEFYPKVGFTSAI